MRTEPQSRDRLVVQEVHSSAESSIPFYGADSPINWEVKSVSVPTNLVQCHIRAVGAHHADIASMIDWHTRISRNHNPIGFVSPFGYPLIVGMLGARDLLNIPRAMDRQYDGRNGCASSQPLKRKLI
ncbi:MAG: hypothetical protein HC869_00560 [Rhodospirillales bacterium]|nr:hypothetical protein [Rhodospirillales bacterium]